METNCAAALPGLCDKTPALVHLSESRLDIGIRTSILSAISAVQDDPALDSVSIYAMYAPGLASVIVYARVRAYNAAGDGLSFGQSVAFGPDDLRGLDGARRARQRVAWLAAGVRDAAQRWARGAPV